ncbi:hypothetical protein BJ170DRAFT_282972 [Xylariales sp. AK1849]|nr:hypothetical protein BJ170DRAFT_282972 [Xylariales sp. AK1849]
MPSTLTNTVARASTLPSRLLLASGYAERTCGTGFHEIPCLLDFLVRGFSGNVLHSSGSSHQALSFFIYQAGNSRLPQKVQLRLQSRFLTIINERWHFPLPQSGLDFTWSLTPLGALRDCARWRPSAFGKHPMVICAVFVRRYSKRGLCHSSSKKAMVGVNPFSFIMVKVYDTQLIRAASFVV